ncbi:MAG: hypothetical protein WC208_16510 [Gallionella sp.]|jgi:hypothetical protein
MIYFIAWIITMVIQTFIVLFVAGFVIAGAMWVLAGVAVVLTVVINIAVELLNGIWLLVKLVAKKGGERICQMIKR